MKRIKLHDKAHEYIKIIAKRRKETILNTVDFILDVFQQIPIQALLPSLGPSPKIYKTYKVAYYEQNKHKLEEHQRKYYEKSKDRMKVFYDAHRKEMKTFKLAYALVRKTKYKEGLKEYNKNYYLRRKGL